MTQCWVFAQKMKITHIQLSYRIGNGQASPQQHCETTCHFSEAYTNYISELYTIVYYQSAASQFDEIGRRKVAFLYWDALQ